MRAKLRFRALGLTFLVLMLVAIYLVYAVFTQKFISFTDVKVEADNIGLQLPEKADVKVRGKIIGQVQDATPRRGGGATLTLGLKPDVVREIPANVTASILPKTLFGEKYVALEVPSKPSSTALRSGQVIAQTKLPIEVEKVLSDIYPLLRTIQPAELDYTLNALANALEGRGDEIGNNLQVLNNYLIKMNPKVPELIADLKLLDKVSDTYADVAPQLGSVLRNTTLTGNTLLTKQQRLNSFLTQTTALSNTATGFLDTNGDNIVKLGKVSEPTLALLARYSPEFPCLLGGLVNQAPKLASTFRGFVFHINLRLIPKQPRGYTAADVPVYGDSRGPYCGTLPTPPFTPDNPKKSIPNFKDGVAEGNNDLKRTGTGFDTSRTTPSSAAPAVTVTGTPAEKAVMVSLAAPVLGEPADQVGDVATLLFGPLARGTEVSMR